MTLALSCLTLAACATQSQNAALQCGGGGFAAAYAACKVLGHTDHQCLIAAAVGGAVGAGACYSYASNLERRRAALRNHENDLDARIQYVRGLNQDAEQLNADLSKQVAETKRSTDALVAQLAQRQVTNERLAQERKKRDEAIAVAKAQADKSSEALAELKTYQARARPQSPVFDAELARQEQFDGQVQRQIALLVAQRSRV